MLYQEDFKIYKKNDKGHLFSILAHTTPYWGKEGDKYGIPQILKV